MKPSNDPSIPESDVQILERTIREVAEHIGAEVFAQSLVEVPAEQRLAA